MPIRPSFATRYNPLLPVISDSIRRTLHAHAAEKGPVTSFSFTRLPQYFPPNILNSASLAVTDDPPRPPLSALGLSEFAAFENEPISGITYLDTYFLTPSSARDESTHFHEMVHVIQWRVLGSEQFLLLYAAGLAEYGYLDSPLEKMAYEHQRRFDAGEPPYPVEEEAQRQTLALLNR